MIVQEMGNHHRRPREKELRQQLLEMLDRAPSGEDPEVIEKLREVATGGYWVGVRFRGWQKDRNGGEYFNPGINWLGIASKLGEYAGKSLMDFEVYGSDAEQRCQLMMIERLRSTIDKIHLHVRNGRNILLMGSVGTGKDHCLAVLLRAAMECSNYEARFFRVNGFFEFLQKGFDKSQREKDLMLSLARCDILALSDLADPTDRPLSGKWHKDVLHQVLEERQARGRGVWMTVNIDHSAGSPPVDEQLVKAFGEPVKDRLLEDCTEFIFHWRSYRTQRQNELDFSTTAKGEA